jgi:hypothetical protein
MLPGLHEAQIRDEDPVLETSLENGLSFLRPELFFVNKQADHIPSPLARFLLSSSNIPSFQEYRTSKSLKELLI